MTIGANAEHY